MGRVELLAVFEEVALDDSPHVPGIESAEGDEFWLRKTGLEGGEDFPLRAVIGAGWIIDATDDDADAGAEAGREPAEIVAVVELIEGIKEEDDAFFPVIVAQALGEPEAEAVEIELRVFPGLAFGLRRFGERNAAPVEFVDEASDEVVAAGGGFGGADEMGDREGGRLKDEG